MKLTQRALSRSFMAAISSTTASLMMVGIATAQPEPSCFTIDVSGQKIDLTDICYRKTSKTTQQERDRHVSVTTTENTISDPLSETGYFVGNGIVPFSLGTYSYIYYPGDRPIYIRRYRQAPRLSTRNSLRSILPESNVNNLSWTGYGQTSLVIYRYQK